MDTMNGRKFFMNPAGSRHAYCSCCGKSVLQDRYNQLQHAKLCGFSENDIPEILTEESYRYIFEKEDEETLCLIAGRPYMKLRSGFRDRYEGGGWERVYEARFRWNSRKVEEKGQQDLKSWLYLISQNNIPYMGEEPLTKVIASVFPVVPDIYDLVMFFQIYKSKGYQVFPYQPSEAVRKRFGQSRPGELLSHIRKMGDQKKKQSAVYGDIIEDQGHTLLCLRVYRYVEAGEEKTWEYSWFLAGEGILWLPGRDYPGGLAKFILNTVNPLEYLSKDTVQRFDKACPSFGLGAYLDGGGQNVLFPFLLSGNYHKGMELLIKSGMSWYADHYFVQEKTVDGGTPIRVALYHKDPKPWGYRNVPELLGLPTALLKTVDPVILQNEEVRARLNHCYLAKRPLLEGISINRCVLRFLQDQDITRDHSVLRNRIAGLTRLTDKDYRKILRYLSGLRDAQYEEYRDYLQMMHMTNITSYGLCPKNLEEAHDDLMRSVQTSEQRERDIRFRRAVNHYKDRETEQEGVDEALREAPYFIKCPKDIDELNREGRMQHNCVASYRDAVIAERSQIFFMRSREAPDDSLVTIEVQKNKLIQAKAAFNKKAPDECQEYVCLWCDSHGINYDNCHDITLKKTG